MARSWREVSSWARSLREVNWLVSGSVEGGTGVGSSCGESESIAAAWWWMDGWYGKWVSLSYRRFVAGALGVVSLFCFFLTGQERKSGLEIFHTK